MADEHSNNDDDHDGHGHDHGGGNGGGHAHHIKAFRNKFWISLVLTIPVLLLSEMIQMWFGFKITVPYQGEIVFVLSTIIYFYGGWPFLKGLYSEVSDKQPGMMTLIGMAISVAFFYSAATVFFIDGRDFFWELATLIDVMLLGHWIEAKSVMGASQALDELAKLMPSKAHKITNGSTEDVEISKLEKGDKVLVKPGENIPADGEIIDGRTNINESLVTGESKPVQKGEGDEVIGGTINGEKNQIKIKVNKAGEDSYLSQVMNMVKEAQESKSKTQDTADKAAAALFYIALGAGIITYVVWFLTANPDVALERSVTVMVIACPHALGLAIPLVVALSTSITAKTGILIRERSSFEKLRNIDAIIFDKTGTLTEGNFAVDKTVALKDESEMLKYAAAVEQNSEHIIAESIVDHVKEKDIDIPDSKDFESETGVGVHATVDGKKVELGGDKILRKKDYEIDNDEIKKLRGKGNTIIYVFANDELYGAISLADKIREDSYEAVKKLQEMNIDVYMLTGDSEDVAKAVASELGIKDYFAEVMPEDKSDKVAELKEKGKKVAMVGDGINDAPALASADIGIAIGAGTSIAVESGEIVLVESNPKHILKAIKFSDKMYSKMIQNLWWAAGYNIIALPLAAGVLAWAGIVIQPAVGALLMSASTVIVAINSQTLRKEDPEG